MCVCVCVRRTAGTPGSKSPAGSGGACSSVPEVKTPTAPQNKALQNVKGEHPSVRPFVDSLCLNSTENSAQRANHKNG